jgi:hypothetical protein
MRMNYRIKEADGAYWVMLSNDRVAGPFTSAEAWSWLDQHSVYFRPGWRRLAP